MTAGPEWIFLDVAGTLLGKPGIFDVFETVLAESGHPVARSALERMHTSVKEATTFPVTTSAAFYRGFNGAVLEALDVPVGDELLDALARGCRGVPWEPYDDVAHLDVRGLRVGVLSNWDHGLRDRLRELLPALAPERITGSAYEGVEKPDPRLFRRATDGLDVAPEQVVLVGDSVELDMAPAAALGWTPVLVDRLDLHPSFPGHRVRTLADVGAVIDSLN